MGSAFYASPNNIKSKLFCVYASQLTNNRKSKPLVFYTLVNNTFLYFIIKYILFKKKKVYIYIYIIVINKVKKFISLYIYSLSKAFPSSFGLPLFVFRTASLLGSTGLI